MDSVIPLLQTPLLGTALWMWLSFSGIVTALLFIDLGVLHQDDHVIRTRESLLLSAGYIGIALLFGAGVWWQLGERSGMDYFTGFVIEKSLSVDNVFVIATIFSYLATPAQYQYRVLLWGIVGVVLLRGMMIFMGTALIHEFSWVLYAFGAFLVLTGIQMWLTAKRMPDVASNRMLKWLSRWLPTTTVVTSHAFFVRKPDAATGRPTLWATPLFVALLLVESADLVFAVDSVPATFAVTTDPFIVYTSNIFAVLGLRALYFTLAALINRFHYLKYALALVLAFIGGKILLAGVVGEVPGTVSLSVTLGLIAGGILVSLWKARSGQRLVQQA